MIESKTMSLKNVEEGYLVLLHQNGGLFERKVFSVTKTMIKLGKERTEGWFRRTDGRPYGCRSQDSRKISYFDADLLERYEAKKRHERRARLLSKIDWRNVEAVTVDHVWKVLEGRRKY